MEEPHPQGSRRRRRRRQLRRRRLFWTGLRRIGGEFWLATTRTRSTKWCGESPERAYDVDFFDESCQRGGLAIGPLKDQFMRIVLIGVSHWHTPFYSDPVLAMTDAAIVGVSDPDAERAPRLWRRAPKCPVFTDFRDMCTTLQPDFAFVLGRHCDMADAARFLIDSRIPFAIEKPCAVNAAEAHDIARRAASAGVFAAVPLVFRYCPIIDTIREIAAGEAIQYLSSCKFVGGMVGRSLLLNKKWNG